jgi:dephospho-CoA kinase
MTFQFKPAVRENVNLLVSLAGSSGSGKTMSAMELATGICGDKPFAQIDTEHRRGLHYASMYRFDHCELDPPFTPDRYCEAIIAADSAGYKCIVVDNFSHEWAGEGGILDMQEEELDRMAGDDYKKRDACKMAAWVRPKMQHKAMIQKLLRIKAHLIICLRAEEKVEMKKDPSTGKTIIVPSTKATGLDGWIPIAEKNLQYEMTTSFLLMFSNPGMPHPIKLQHQHRDIFPANKLITRDCGKRLAEWAASASVMPPTAPDTTPAIPQAAIVPATGEPEPFDDLPTIKPGSPIGDPPVTTGRKITDAQKKRMFAIATSKGWSTQRAKDLLGTFGFEHSADVTMAEYPNIIKVMEGGPIPT